ncbi:hypothetical protein KA005_56830, partial [bacterium]|nr:hypothetical protein [bacterium]
MQRKTYLLLLVLIVFSNLTLNAQIERPKWEIGGGLRLNYLGLDGGYSGERYEDNYEFELNYKDIGMDTYSPSFAIAMGGRFDILPSVNERDSIGFNKPRAVLPRGFL